MKPTPNSKRARMHTQDNHPRRRVSALVTTVAAVAAAGLSVASAYADNNSGYYPDPSSPLNNNPGLELVQAALQAAHATETLVLPVPTGFTAPTTKDLAAAIQAAVASDISTNSGANVAEIADALAKYAPSKAATNIGTVASAILTSGASDPATLISDVTTAASSVAGGKYATSVVTSIVKAIVAAKQSGAITEIDDATEAGVASAPALAGKTVAAAIAADKLGSASDIGSIASAAVTGAGSATSIVPSIIQNAVAAAAKLSKTAPAPFVTSATSAALTAAVTGSTPVSLSDVYVAAAAAGAGATQSSAVTAGVDAALTGSAATNGDATVAAFNDIKTKSNPNPKANLPLPQDEVTTYLSANSSASTDAVVAGAVAAWGKVAPAIIASALTNGNGHGGAAPADIITTGVLANPAEAALDAKLLVSNATTTPDVVVQSVISGANAASVGLVVADAIKGFPKASIAANLPAIVTGAIKGAEQSGFTNAIASIGYNAAKASASSVTAATDAVNQILTNAGSNASSTTTQLEAAQIAAGAVSADKKNAGAIKTAVDGALTNAGVSTALVDAAANVANAILNPVVVKGQPKDPILFYNAANQALSGVSDPNTILAVLYGASQANPKGTSALVALAVSKNPAVEAQAVSAATGANYKAAANIQAAADAAYFASGAPANLFDYTVRTTTANSALATDIATGLTIGDPGQTHIVAHALAFAQPAAVAKAVPVFFSFSNIVNAPNILGGTADPVARAAAITAGFTDGIIEANLKPTQATSILKASVVSAVKSALLLTGANIATPSGTQASTGPAALLPVMSLRQPTRTRRISQR